jgi:hypothetical protein
MTSPTHYDILNWKIWLALPVIRSFTLDFANRTPTRYHDELDGMITPSGVELRLSDPAIDALLDLLPFRLLDNYTFCNLGMAISRLSASQGSFKDYEKSIPSLQRLSDLRVSGGWHLLDELFMAGWGRDFSSSVDKIGFFYQPEDQGLGGPSCYRINLTLSKKDPFDNFHVLDTFALASSPTHLTALLQRIVDGTLPIEMHQEAVPVRNIRVLFEDRFACNVPVSQTLSNDLQQRPATPMVVHWDRCEVLNGDPAFMKAIADWAPHQEGLRLKAKFLEGSLGL